MTENTSRILTMDLKEVNDAAIIEKTQGLCAEYLGGIWKSVDAISLLQVL